MTDCYIVQDGERIAIIDAPFPADSIIDVLRRESITPDEVLLTHAHHDHVFGLERIRNEFPGIEIYVSAEDMVYLENNGKVLRDMLRAFDRAFMDDVKDIPIPSDILTYRDYHGSFSVISTPGHTAGSVALYSKEGNLVFTGDTLFSGGAGRTDIGGDYSDLMRSLAKLAELPDETFVLPGHGGISTIGNEKRMNPYMMR